MANRRSTESRINDYKSKPNGRSPSRSGQTTASSDVFRTITFSDGTELELEEDDIVVFVGPNNAGKSAALRELEAWVARSTPGLVVKDAELHKDGTQEDLRTYLESNAQRSGIGGNLHYGGMGYNIHHSHLHYFDNSDDRHPVAPFFAKSFSRGRSDKHRMAKLADALRSLDVPVSVIADIDILDEEATFRKLFETLGGNWEEVRTHWKTVCDAVVSQRPPRNAQQVKDRILQELDGISGTGDFPKKQEGAIKQVFKDASPWGAMKSNGRNALPSGEPTRHFDELYEKCSGYGLWIVPVGEIEGFCRSLGSHGPGFVEKVLEERDIGADPELQEARVFVKRVWAEAKPM